jgi:hypothetical protein
VQDKALVVNVRVLVEVIYPFGVEERRAAFDAVHFVAFSEEEFGEVRAVLAGDARDEGDFFCGVSHVYLKWTRAFAFMFGRAKLRQAHELGAYAGKYALAVFASLFLPAFKPTGCFEMSALAGFSPPIRVKVPAGGWQRGVRGAGR